MRSGSLVSQAASLGLVAWFRIWLPTLLMFVQPTRSLVGRRAAEVLQLHFPVRRRRRLGRAVDRQQLDARSRSFSNSLRSIPNGGTANYFGGFSPYMLNVVFNDCQSPAR